MSCYQPFFLLTLQGTVDGRIQVLLERKASPAAGGDTKGARHGAPPPRHAILGLSQQPRGGLGSPSGREGSAGRGSRGALESSSLHLNEGRGMVGEGVVFAVGAMATPVCATGGKSWAAHGENCSRYCVHGGACARRCVGQGDGGRAAMELRRAGRWMEGRWGALLCRETEGTPLGRERRGLWRRSDRH
jgi:hypothetical protein